MISITNETVVDGWLALTIDAGSIIAARQILPLTIKDEEAFWFDYLTEVNEVLNLCDKAVEFYVFKLARAGELELILEE